MTARKLHEEMSSIGVIFSYLSRALDGTLKGTLSEQERREIQTEVRRLAGIGSGHAAEKSPLIPFVESVLETIQDPRTEVDRVKLFHLAHVLNGDEAETYELCYEPLQFAGEASPNWLARVLDAFQSDFNADQLGALFRNIPGDTTFGILSYEFLSELLKKPPDLEAARLLWLGLSGQAPLVCTVQVQGMTCSLQTKNSR